jgi:hypothetical protein
LICFMVGARGVVVQWRRLYAATWRGKFADTQRPRTVGVTRHIRHVYCLNPWGRVKSFFRCPFCSLVGGKCGFQPELPTQSARTFHVAVRIIAREALNSEGGHAPLAALVGRLLDAHKC